MSNRRQILALRALEEGRAELRWAKVMTAGAFAITAAVITGWTFVIMLMEGAGLVWSIVGLCLLSVGAIIAPGGALTYLFQVQKALRKAQYGYEDTFLEAA